MSPVEIKVALLRKGITQTAIANEIGVAITSVNRVIAGLNTSHRIADAVSDAVGKPKKEVFPNYRKPKNFAPKARLTQ